MKALFNAFVVSFVKSFEAKSNWLTKLDVIAAFYKVRAQEGGEWKTAFRSRCGLREWLVTTFGLAGAPATFQR